MSAARNVVKVSILDEEFTIRTEASLEHTIAVAEHVDRTMRQIIGSGSSVEARKAAILAALQIADELLHARTATEDLTDRMRDLSADIRPWLPPKKRHD